MDITICKLFCFKMFYMKYYEYKKSGGFGFVVGLVFFHFYLWLWGFFFPFT